MTVTRPDRRGPTGYRSRCEDKKEGREMEMRSGETKQNYTWSEKRHWEQTCQGAKILRERLYPVKINGANRSAVLDSNGNLLPGVTEALGQENEVTIAKINWLGDKGNGKAYGSMVVYVTESDARRLLEDKYFHLGGESARTSVFEPRAGVVQCYNYRGLGHKAFVCKETHRCGRCAERGHCHRQCEAAELMCVSCGGRHESFRRACRLRQMRGDEH
ncbi:hypothetical protein FOXG_22053 [Fusarium oxysporum f. sp. lycopersici 4287]|uniref:CCHC-type domain-containing protein n=1 Tax=Fusarium oxysporum f. sp. lycopersici (strain 4287 / CBS 123668 / FGSC 9935 / NRRL 34936) TaxID=426428 RepID=A0A0J9W4T9_FUSO4|nr:hypothetical protein FOXG_22053 [Fusarium oxysporum f. sp. lycopersici 4287]KNB17801.1 hypothetical protein FOXG_22053 [Fusarium oxysporum f. sp. lycopersici 4287]